MPMRVPVNFYWLHLYIDLNDQFFKRFKLHANVKKVYLFYRLNKIY